MNDVCRLCLTYIPEINKLSKDDYISYDTKLKLIMPEIDISRTTTFVLCEQCSESLNSAYSFKSRCLEVEKLITDYLKEINTTVIDLKHLKIQRYNCENDDTAEIQSSVDVKFICNESESKEDVTNSNQDLHQEDPLELNSDSNKIEICETKISAEPVKKRQVTEMFKCDTCDKLFARGYFLKRHQEIHNRQQEIHNRKNFICEICKEVFKTSQSLKKHKKIHTMIKCSICPKFVRNIEKHMQLRHVHKYICDVCGAKFPYNSTLIEHQRSHTGDRPFSCETCGKSFTQGSSLYVHIRSVHTNDKRHVCETCGKGFAKPVELRKHAVVHTPNRERKFVCEAEGCDKAFTTKERRREHMKRHTLVKNFRCTVCDKAFYDNHGLRRHIKVHTGEKPFECSICSKTFGQKGNLRIHMKSHRPKTS